MNFMVGHERSLDRELATGNWVLITLPWQASKLPCQWQARMIADQKMSGPGLAWLLLSYPILPQLCQNAYHWRTVVNVRHSSSPVSARRHPLTNISVTVTPVTVSNSERSSLRGDDSRIEIPADQHEAWTSLFAECLKSLQQDTPGDYLVDLYYRVTSRTRWECTRDGVLSTYH